MNLTYLDIHCHLNFDAFDADRDEVIARARENKVGMIVVGTDKVTSEKAIKLAEEHPDIWAIIGLHPTEISGEIHREVFDMDTYRKMALHPKVVAIGECGLDYYRGKIEDKEIQQEIFEAQISLANEVKKPLMLHIRSGLEKEKNAYTDALEILKKYAKVPGDVHFFVGSVEEGRQFIDLGFRLSFTGVITFVRDYDEIIKNVPLNMIMCETDAPFVAPEPYRSTDRQHRNEPSYVVEIAHKIAEIRGESVDVVIPHLIDNAKKLFHITDEMKNS